MLRRSMQNARYNMKATILHQTTPTGNASIDPNINAAGTFVKRQDPLTGEIIRVWQPVPIDDPNTPTNELDTAQDIWCMARGIISAGIRAAATTEYFGKDYQNVDLLHIYVPPIYTITKRDRITNIRDKNDVILWRDEEYEDTGEVRATTFNVQGVIPEFDPFNRILGNFVFLERAEV